MATPQGMQHLASPLSDDQRQQLGKDVLNTQPSLLPDDPKQVAIVAAK